MITFQFEENTYRAPDVIRELKSMVMPDLRVFKVVEWNGQQPILEEDTTYKDQGFGIYDLVNLTHSVIAFKAKKKPEQKSK